MDNLITSKSSKNVNNDLFKSDSLKPENKFYNNSYDDNDDQNGDDQNGDDDDDNIEDDDDVEDIDDVSYNSEDEKIDLEKKEYEETFENEESDVNEILRSDRSDISEEDYSSDEDQFKKLDNSRILLQNMHKNLEYINYIEVEKLSKISRDDNNNIIDKYHMTVPILSKYEKTRVLGLRTKQINSGATPFINVDEDIIDGYTIAEKELIEKKIPFIIKRPISNNKFEYWKLEDLEIV